MKKILLILPLFILASCFTVLESLEGAGDMLDVTNDIRKSEQCWRDGLKNQKINFCKDGPWKTFYSNGQLKEHYNHIDGVRQGPSEWYHDNGLIFRKGTFKNGKKDGPWEVYNRDGSLRYKGIYKEGLRVD